jgi:hypothetical protein
MHLFGSRLDHSPFFFSSIFSVSFYCCLEFCNFEIQWHFNSFKFLLLVILLFHNSNYMIELSMICTDNEKPINWVSHQSVQNILMHFAPTLTTFSPYSRMRTIYSSNFCYLYNCILRCEMWVVLEGRGECVRIRGREK